MKLRIRRLLTPTLFLTLAAFATPSVWAQDVPLEAIAPENKVEKDETTPGHSAIIQNGVVQLGVRNEGNLGLCCGTWSMGGATTWVGVRYMPTNGEATAPGCVCEGWGVADATTGQAAAANVAVDGVWGMAFNSFTSTSDTAVTVVTAFGRLRVTHDYHPSPVTPNLYEALVTIENISGTAIGDLRYTRVMDWDIAPNTFHEYTSIQGFGSAANLLFTSSNGFNSANPLASRYWDYYYYTVGNQWHNGPTDHGAVFDFGFGALAPGASISFRIFYGAAQTETQALNALAAVGAEAYSLGQPSAYYYGPVLDGVHTFAFGFTGVGGEPIIPPAIKLSPEAAVNEIGTHHVLTATVKDKKGDPVPGVVVTFSVLSGPNTGVLGTATTDASGQALLGYSSSLPGIDTIQASFEDPVSGHLISNTVTKEWVEPRNRPPTVSLSASPSEFYEGDPGSSLAAVADDPDGDTLVVTWSLSGPGSLSSSGLGATYTNAEGPALATVTVTVTDPKGESASASAAITVHNVAPTITITSAEINEGGVAALTVTVADPGPLDPHVVTIDWADDSVPTVVTLAAGITTVTVTHAYPDDDPSGTPFDIYTINGGVTDDDGGIGGAVAAVKVNNVAPVLGAITAPTTPQAVGSPVAISASVSDVGTEDTHTCVVDWGDMTTSAGTVGGGTCSATHTYTEAGVYSLTMTVTDDDTGTATSIFQYVVVYDPSGGFVTGGGWINSPAGAYSANPSLTGRANFGFVSKYQRGATVPTGQTQFQFKAGDLNFHSSVYEWLVVAGAKAQYKGEGTINGSGDYAFLLTVTDGQQSGGGGVDKFRIKIWDRTSGGLVYDNKLGDPDDLTADPQAISGGSIVIHNR